MEIVYCLLMFLPLALCQETVKQTLFIDTNEDNVTFDDEHLLSNVTARSKVHCARLCSSTEDCITFTFTKGSPTGTCRLYQEVMSHCRASAPPGTKKYTLKQQPVMDPCAASRCQHNCTKTGTSFTCSCQPGYVLNACTQRTCDDIDECATNTSGCSQMCNNTVGSFTCGCLRGYVLNTDNKTCDAWCSLHPDSEEWTVFQRRQDGSVDFYRNWFNYSSGFGNSSGEMWLGLETLHNMTSNGTWMLRIDLEDWEGNKTYAMYTGFYITNSSDNYRLMFDNGSYCGTAGDSLQSQRAVAFSTYDADHDASGNCAVSYHSAWWFANSYVSHLNGEYKPNSTTTVSQGLIWYYWHGDLYSMKCTEMKIKRL